MKNSSGYESYLPSKISLKLLTVSSLFTYLPGLPENFSATKNGWLKKLLLEQEELETF